MTTHSSILVWRLLGMGEPSGLLSVGSILVWRLPGMGETGGLLSVGSHRVRHD